MSSLIACESGVVRSDALLIASKNLFIFPLPLTLTLSPVYTPPGERGLFMKSQQNTPLSERR